jgi:hypothetical protein
METMKTVRVTTLAEFKRALQVGRMVHTVYHCKTDGERGEKGVIQYKDESKGIARITQVKSSQFAVERMYKEVPTDSWCNYPKATECRFNENGSITILEQDHRHGAPTYGKMIPVLTYRVLEERMKVRGVDTGNGYDLFTMEGQYLTSCVDAEQVEGYLKRYELELTNADELCQEEGGEA